MNTSRSSKNDHSVDRKRRFNYMSGLGGINNEKILTSRTLRLDMLEQGKRHYKDNNLPRAVDCLSKALVTSPMNLEIQYMLGVCQLSLNNFPEASKYFCLALAQSPTYRKNLYLLLAICFKKEEQFEQSILTISKAFEFFPEYSDGYLYRAKLYLKTKKYALAIADFSKALEIDPANTVTLQARSDCLRMMGELDKAVVGYTEFLGKEPYNPEILLKRGITYFEMKEYRQGDRDFQRLIDLKKGGSDVYYFKGMVDLKSKNISDASLYFSEAITENTSSRAVSKSIEELAIIKIEQRDFYEAYEVLKRRQFLEGTETSCIDRLMKFVEGIIFLMKRKFDEAIVNFDSIEKEWFEQPRKNSEFLLPLYYSYCGYGLFCLGRHKQALTRCYNRLPLPLEPSSAYNKTLCQGVVAYSENHKTLSLEKFQGLLTSDSQRMEPYFYIGVQLIRDSILTQSSDAILRAVQMLTEGLQVCELSNLYYYRTLVYMFLAMNGEALEDIDKAIEKSEDNVPKYFYIRGLIFAMEGNFKQAISDLTTCLSLDEKLYEALVERAKCYMLENELVLAYNDIEQVPDNKHWLAVFFIHNNQFAEAYEIIEKQDDQELYEVVCLRLGRWHNAGVSGKLCQAIVDSKMEICSLLEGAINSGIAVGYFQVVDLLVMRGYLAMGVDCEEAIRYFKQALGQLAETSYEDSSSIEEEYNDIKMVQIKCNICFAMFEQGDAEQAIALLTTLKDETCYTELKYKMEELLLHITEAPSLTKVVLFNQHEMLSKFLPERTLPLPAPSAPLSYRPYISFPLLPLPSVTSSFNINLLKNFTLEDVENRPEAPWIKRNSEGIVFTSDVQVFEHLKLDTSACADEEDGQEEDEGDESEEDREAKFQRLRMELKLDSRVEERLSRITHRD